MSEPIREAAAGVTVDDDEHLWRRITQDTRRDLMPITQARMVELAAYLWESNLLADRLIELPVAYLLGEGVRLTAPAPEDQAALDAFWRHPLNRMDLRLESMIRELSLFGEQVYPVYVGHNGAVRITTLDPSLISVIVTDPDDPATPIGIVTVRDDKGRYRKLRILYNGPESMFGAKTQAIRSGFTDGAAFYLSIRRLSSGKRGRSDLLAASDWLDGYERFLFGELDRTDFLRAFVWDVTISGLTDDQVKERAKTITAPKPGSVRVHNQSETWEAVAPDLKAADTDAAARTFRNHLLGGATVPEHWFGGGGDVNRATAGEMGEPTFKVLSQRQRLWKAALEQIGTYVVRARRGVLGSVAEDADFGVLAVFPELSARDTTRWATALQQVAASTQILLDRGLWTRDRALRAVEDVASRLGTTCDPVELLAAAQREAEQRAEADTFTMPPLPEEPAAP
ncbi:hypothetical protein [Plasticicumulans sp.]|uniref:hypothetical protein n=1 Tax=Plasticicumulans sp. TaxID=2307179 RepID=UPI00321FD170